MICILYQKQAHIPSVESITVESVLLLVISGTLAGVMFSLAAMVGYACICAMILWGRRK